MQKDNDKYILITGGAGYIGTNVANTLLSENNKVIVVDNFTNSYPKHIEKLKQIYGDNLIILNLDITNKEALNSVFEYYDIKSVVHLAAKKNIPESFVMPEEYYRVNVLATQQLLELMTKHGVDKIVFSSTITVYANQNSNPVKESDGLAPASPYAQTKVDGENLIKSWATTNNKSAVILRLSNPIGANDVLNLGDDSPFKLKGIVPYLIECLEENKEIKIYGNNHPTKDGSTIRDYVHVTDVARAFAAACNLETESNIETFNIGTGKNGFSVLDIIHTLENIYGKQINYSVAPKRSGDNSIITSDISHAEQILNFTPDRDLKRIILTQYNFNNANQTIDDASDELTF